MTALTLILVALAGYAAFIVALLAFVSVCKKESSRPG